MNTLESPDNKQLKSPPPSGGIDLTGLPDPRRAAILAIIPGLGQLYNGEKGKGILYLAVGLFNLTAIVTMLFPVQIVGAIGQAGALVGLHFNEAVSCELMKALSTRAVFLVYLVFSAYFLVFTIQDAYETATNRRDGAFYESFPLAFSEAASGSYLFHLAVMVSFLIAVLFMVAPQPPRETATLIEFIEPEPVVEPEPPPPPPTAAPKKREPKPALPPPRPAVVTPAVTPDAPVVPVEEPPPSPIAAEPGPAVDSGFAGGTENGSDFGVPGGIDKEVDFSSYLADMQRRIKKQWHPPKGNESKTVTLKFLVSKNGTVQRIRLVKSSGLSIVDNAAKVAVMQAAPFAPLPKGAADEVDIKFTFDYNVFNGGQAARFWN